jgi:hypothetical protein
MKRKSANIKILKLKFSYLYPYYQKIKKPVLQLIYVDAILKAAKKCYLRSWT